MNLHAHSLTLQLLGIPGDQYNPSAVKPIGTSIELAAGLFSEPEHQLGVINLDSVPLPKSLLDASWLLCGYRIGSAGTTGEQLETRLGNAQLMHRSQLDFIPPGCIQPFQAVQPGFTLSTLMRNPCPGWVERVHLYSNPNEPFAATSVMYLDQTSRIAAVEMFDIPLRHTHHPAFKRIWLALSY